MHSSNYCPWEHMKTAKRLPKHRSVQPVSLTSQYDAQNKRILQNAQEAKLDDARLLKCSIK